MVQLLNRSTIYGWLLILAALQPAVGDEQDPVLLVRRCPLPVALVDLERRRIVAMSGTLLEMLARDQDGIDAADLVTDPRPFYALADLLRQGAIDAYEARREVRRGDGSLLTVDVWASVTLDVGRHLALLLYAPVGAEVATNWGECPLQLWPVDAPGVTVGIFDSSWQITQLSDDAERLLGKPASELVGSSMLDHLELHDVPGFLAAVGQALATRASTDAHLRLRGASGALRDTFVVIAPIAASPLQFGFVATSASPAGSDSPDVAQRLAVLERRFRRIAQEIEAAGFIDRAPELADEPALAELSGRQSEILARLVRGERVPGIAGAMFVNQSTVRSHLTAIYRKLGVHSQAELLAALRSRQRL